MRSIRDWVLLLVVSGAFSQPSEATTINFSGAFEATFPTGSVVAGFSGDFSFSVDGSTVPTSGSAILQVPLDTLSITQNWPGKTWDTSNVRAEITFFGGAPSTTGILNLYGFGEVNQFNTEDTGTGLDSTLNDLLVSYSSSNSALFNMFSASYSVASEQGVPAAVWVNGTASYNATESIATPETTVSIFGGTASTGGRGIQLDFETGFVGDVTVTPNPVPSVQPNFQVASTLGGQSLFYDIDLSADPGGDVELTFQYDKRILAGLGLTEDELTVYHFDGTRWDALDTTLNGCGSGSLWYLCSLTGIADSFSIFAVGGASADDDGGQASVPEPATVALLGLGLAGLGFARRRKAQ